MSYLRTVKGSDAFLNARDPGTWDITVRLERHHKYCAEERDSALRLYDYKGWEATAAALGLRANLLENDNIREHIKAIEKSESWLGGRLRSKLQALETFPFRLLTKCGIETRQRSRTDERASFICLSYRWWSDWIQGGSDTGFFPLSPALRVDSYHGKHEIPDKRFVISDCMWNAFLAERRSESEGIWVDQMCLHQDDSAEIHSAVSSMNMLYMAARKVVIVIEDVIFWSDEVRAMIKLAEEINQVPIEDRSKMNWTSWTVAADPLVLGAAACAIHKIEGSTWFRRVWCNHELQNGQEFTFLIPVMEREPPPEGVDSVAVLKLDAKALATFLEASRRCTTIGDLNSFLWHGWLNNIQEDKHVGNEPRIFYGFNAVTHFSKEVYTPQSTLIFKAHGWPTTSRSAMHILCDTLQFKGARSRDVLAVILNTKYPTIAYAEVDPTIPEIVWVTNIIALAHGDLSPLLTACRTQNWIGKTVRDLPFRRYSWATWPDPLRVTRVDRPAQGLRVNHEIVDEGLKLVVAATGSSHTVRQMHGVEEEFPELQTQFLGMLKFDRYLESEKRIARERTRASRDDGRSVDIEIDSRYVQHVLHAFMIVTALEEDAKAKVVENLSNSGLVPKDIDIASGLEACERITNELGDFDAEPGIDEFARFRGIWQDLKPVLNLAESIVRVLIGPEWSFKSKQDHDDTIFISVIHGFNQQGEEWIVLASLPSAKDHGFYWLVRPDALVEATHPDVQKYLDANINFSLGGTWAVQVEGFDEEQSQSTSIWNETGNDEINPHKELEEDALRMKLLSRNVLILPSEPWNRPLYTRTVIIHA